jgi:PHD/YefM family antitoxin component YafN of YafNO toxin-antitoxin module
VAKVDTDRIISITDAGKIGLAAVMADAEEHGYTIIARRNSLEAAVIPMDRYSALQEAERRWRQDYEESRDWMLTISRILTDDGDRTSFDDVLAKFGYTREELAAIPD